MTLADELRARANDMREEGIGGWADTCLVAADRIALLEEIAQKQRALLNRYDLAPDGYKMLRDLHSAILQEDKPQ